MNETHDRLKVLFLCTGNSCRSQMAEGWARALKGDTLESYSAGIRAHGLNRIAVQVMRRAGVDISLHRSKTVDKLRQIEFDYVVTVCDQASEACPAFQSKAKVVHQSFDDPPRLAAPASSDEAALGHSERDGCEMRAIVGRLTEALGSVLGAQGGAS